MLEKVISGGQCGADQAAIWAAQMSGLQTGGHIPKGFRTELGQEPNLARFGLVETESDKYPPRTALNVQNSDATLRIAYDFSSRGEQLTRELCQKHNKPYLDVQVLEGGDWVTPPEDVAQWIAENNIRTLNVAGNRETTCPGLHQRAVLHLMRVFSILKEQNVDLTCGSEQVSASGAPAERA